MPTTMACFAKLPLELVRNILAFAALDNVEEHAAWVATLLHISRLAYNTVHPVLVHSIVAPDFAKLCASSTRPELFAQTRNLLIGDRDSTMVVASVAIWMRLSKAFHGVVGYCGSSYILGMLVLDPRFQPRVVVLPPSVEPVGRLLREIMPALNRTTHLHAHASIRHQSHLDLPDLSGLQLTHVVLDLEQCYADAPLLGTIQALLSIPSIQLLVLRYVPRERSVPMTSEFWRQLQSQGDHRLHLKFEVATLHDICLETSSRAFDRSLWTPSMSSFPAWEP